MRKMILMALVASAGLFMNGVSQADDTASNVSDSAQNAADSMTSTMKKSTTTTAKPQLKQQIAQIKKECGADIDKFCSSVTPGGGRIASCLNAHEDKLSSSCKSTWVGAKENVSKRMDRAEVAFRQNCGSDVQKFCPQVPSGEGRILSCLDEHKSDLSNSCKGFQAKVEKRLDEYLS